MASETLRKELYTPQPTPSLPVKTPPVRQQRVRQEAVSLVKERLLLLSALVFVTVIVMVIITRFASIMVNNYELQNLQASINAQNSRNASLQAQVDQLSSPTRILGFAQGVLNMKPAAPIEVGAGNP